MFISYTYKFFIFHDKHLIIIVLLLPQVGDKYLFYVNPIFVNTKCKNIHFSRKLYFNNMVETNVNILMKYGKLHLNNTRILIR